MKEKMTVKEAAAYMGMTRQKISRLIERGVIKTEDNPLDTRQKLISRSQLDQLKEYQQYGAEAEPGDDLDQEELEEVITAFAAGEADRAAGIRITQDDIKRMAAEMTAIYRVKRERGAA